jgi:hypothetical protein
MMRFAGLMKLGTGLLTFTWINACYFLGIHAMLKVDSHVGDSMVPFASRYIIGCTFVQTKDIISKSLCFNPFKLDIFYSSTEKALQNTFCSGFSRGRVTTLLHKPLLIARDRAESRVATLVE